MMRPEDASEALEQFIADFKLKDSSGVISFNAVVHLFIHGRLRIFETDVQIITSDQLNTVYLVNPVPELEGVPEMFSPSTFEFTYVKREGFRMRSGGDGPMIIVSIFPR